MKLENSNVEPRRDMEKRRENALLGKAQIVRRGECRRSLKGHIYILQEAQKVGLELTNSICYSPFDSHVAHTKGDTKGDAYVG